MMLKDSILFMNAICMHECDAINTIDSVLGKCWYVNYMIVQYASLVSLFSEDLMLLCNLMFLPQAIPVALCGRDIIGVAKTGSGKTAAFLWPALVHIMEQPELEVGDGPIALICAPTRELCQQIFFEARRFGKVYNIHSVAVFGGGNKYEQSKALQEGAEIVVATPVSLILWCLLIRVLEQCQRITSTC